MDFVLVLDVSGSMTDEIAYYTYQAINKTSWSVSDVYNAYYQKDILGIPHRTDVTYYAKIDDEYYPVSYQSKWGWGYREHWLEANNKPLGKKVTDSTWKEEVYNQELYTRQTDPNKTTKKLDAMKTAVNNFIESVAAQKNGDTPVAHRISIVKFAGTSTNKVGNDTDGDGENYTQKVTELTDVTANGSVDSLKDAVNDLTAGGATAADWGMQKAKDVLTKRGDNPNPSIVIMFTDGQPNHGSGYSKDVAGAAVDTAKTLKAAGTEVYTIGMFSEANPNDKNGNFNKYMNGVSSNYPNASGTKDRWGNYNDITLGVPADGNYYFKADNAGALDQVFQTISESTTTTSPLDASAVVVDNVPSNFALNEGSVKVYTENCIAKNGETFKWDTKTESTIRPTIEDQSISVTGFNFSEHWCGIGENKQARGQKLIIEFTIKCTNYGGTQPTNAGAYIKANADSTDQIISLKDPEVPVTVQLPNVSNPAAQTKVYKGAGYDITNEISEIIAGLVPVDGIKNQFIDLTYEIKDSSGKLLGTYTIPAGQATGGWSDTSTNITTGPNFGNYTYKITVTGQDKKQPNNDDSKDCTATFTITKRNVTFAGESKRVEWNGKEQTITGITPTGLLQGHTYSGLTYAAKGTDPKDYPGEFSGDLVISDKDNNNVTSNYNVTKTPGKLTIIDSTKEVTVTFKIVGGKWSDDNTAENKTVQVTLTNGKGSLNGVDIPTGSPSEDYTGAGTWSSSDENITGAPAETTEITKDTTFTLTFPQKPAAPVEWDVSRSKIASGLTKNSNGDWTTTVKLTLPTVKQKEAQSGQTIAISKGSYVIDQIGNEFTFVPELTLKVGKNEYTGKKGTSDANGTTYTFGSTEYKVTYTDKNNETNAPAQFKWEINQDIPAETKVTLSYKLKLTTPNKTAGTYGVTDLDGNGFVDGAETTKVVADDALYTNEKAALYIKENDQGKEIAVFPKPSVSYTIKSSSGSHSGGSRPSLNTKDHYGYIIGYPVDYYTGQPTTDQTKKPVRPEGKITRAEVATIYFRMLTDESRTKFWSQSSGYSDVKAGDWFNNAVSTLSNAGIIAGYEDGSFRPNGYITRAEFATIAARFFDVTYSGKDLFPDISGHWAKDYINQAANKGFVNGYEDGTFKPDRNITRAEAVTLVNRTLDRHPDKNHFTKDMLVWPDNMDQTKWYYADMQEATNSHTYQMKENSDKTKYENWTKTLPIRNWEALEKAWSNANSSQGNGNVV